MLRLCAALAVVLSGCGGGSAPGPQPAPPDPDPVKPGPAAHVTALMLPMSDGLRLDTRVHLPGGAGPWPVVLIRTPYSNEREAEYAAEANARGLAVVSQDMRGRFESEGASLPFSGCGWSGPGDGTTTIEWINQAWWCNGRIGMTGGSALGFTQNLVAPTQPAGLDCQFIGVSAASLYHDWVYQGGAFREEQNLKWLENNQFDPEALETWRAHPEYDEYWEQFSIHEKAGEIATPGMHFGCWYDTFCQGTIDSFTLRQHAGAAGAKGRQWLVLGPWIHGVYDITVGEAVFPENARHVPGEPYNQFMDHFLLGEDTGILARPAVTYYLMGALGEAGAPGNYWLQSSDWPPASVEDRYYLHEGGSLSYVPPAAEHPTPFVFDPADASPTLGGRNLLIPAGMYDQQPVESRDDIALFTTAPLEWPVEVTGRVSARLWVSSDAVDTDVAVRLCDVYPDGRSMLIADGILRLRYRDGFDQPAPLTPGQAYEVVVDLWSTAYVFNSGHRIRLSIAGGNWPRWDRNPGTGENWLQGADYVVQHNVLYHDAQHPSYLSLPVVPEHEFPPVL